MTGSQSASRSTPDPDTIHCSVEVSRSSWIVGVHCPLADANIGIRKRPPGGGNDLIEPVWKSQARVGSDVPVMLCCEGFWPVRYLERQAPGIEVVVLDPASLRLKRRTNGDWCGNAMPCPGIVNDAATGSGACCMCTGSLILNLAHETSCPAWRQPKPVVALTCRPVHWAGSSGYGPHRGPDIGCRGPT